MKQILNDDWFLICSKDLNDYGESISRPDYKQGKWYPTSIPNTVFSVLVDNNVYDDPYFGLNLLKIPGYKKNRDIIASLQHKPKESPFKRSWWYRTQFIIDSSQQGQRIWLNFRGINYSANIWLNGKRIASTDYVNGAFRLYDFDITNFAIIGKNNVLAIEVFSPGPDDLAITFIDWAPGMPDDNMGIWQPIILYSSGPLALKNTFVHTRLNTPTLDEAELTIETEIVNTHDHTIETEIECIIENITFNKNITISPLSTNKLIFTPHDFPQLKIRNPRLWWPYQFGKPELYKLRMILKTRDKVSDSTDITFGIREIKAVNNEYGARLFLINGKELLIRGTAWSPDLMLRQSERQDEIDTDFLINLNMNTVRLEGKFATDYFWDLCDQKGILVIAGWPCCNHFEKWDTWKYGDTNVAEESERSQILRLRNHASFAAWFYGSDSPPPENVERIYLEVLQETHNSLPRISSASHKPSKHTGITGVKMTGPYSYVPPIYWYDRKRQGHAERFNTETCPDVCIPIMESIEKMLPKNQLFVGSKAWNHHTGAGDQFNNTKKVDEAILKRYGRSKDLSDYSKTAQVLGYESWRAMYEAHNRNFPKATGVIGWMHNSPWPSLIWQLYDYYLNPTGAFFGTKKACEPLHIQYSYDDNSIWIINNTLEDYPDLKVFIKIHNFDLTKKFSTDLTVDIKEEERAEIFVLPGINDLSSVYFLQLSIEKDQITESKQLYWLTTNKDIFTGEYFWYHSPLKTHADMSLVRKMPRAHIDTVLDIEKINNTYYITVTIINSDEYLAFFIWIKLYNKNTNEIIAPVFWSDNCVSLFPLESIQIKAVIPGDATDGDILIKTEAWNS